MSLLEELRRVRKSAAAAFLEFIQENARSRDSVHAFFEGQSDLSFYTNFLERFIPPPTILYTYLCGGKHGVYETHRKIMQRGEPQSVVVFFVDRDFSDLLNESHPIAETIYVTDHHSVENYLVSSSMLHRLWNEMVQVRAEAKTEADYTGMISILDSHCKLVTPAEYLPAIELVKDELCAIPPKQYVRGKFELWFFIQFINELIRMLRNIPLSVKYKPQIGLDTALSILGPRLSMPPSLEDFLQRNMNKKGPIVP